VQKMRAHHRQNDDLKLNEIIDEIAKLTRQAWVISGEIGFRCRPFGPFLVSEKTANLGQIKKSPCGMPPSPLYSAPKLSVQ